MEAQTFTVESLPGTSFRPKKVTAVELLSIAPMIVSEKLNVSMELYEFVLTHLEVNCNNVWFSVKEPGTETYMPLGIESNIKALNEVSNWFISNVIMAAFRNTSE